MRDVEIAGVKGKRFVLGGAASGYHARWGKLLDPAAQEEFQSGEQAWLTIPADGGFYVILYTSGSKGLKKRLSAFEDAIAASSSS